jgi:hypothetical protein
MPRTSITFNPFQPNNQCTSLNLAICTRALDRKSKLTGVGLTTGMFAEAAPKRGESATCTMIVAGTNGASQMSEAVKGKSAKQMED